MLDIGFSHLCCAYVYFSPRLVIVHGSTYPAAPLLWGSDGSKSAGDFSEFRVLLSFSYSHADGWLLYINTTWHLSKVRIRR